MFSPDEQKAIKAKSLQQWQQEQRAARQSELDQQNLDALALLPPDPMFTQDDVTFLRACVYPISPA